MLRARALVAMFALSVASACSDATLDGTTEATVRPASTSEWRTYGGSLARTFFQPGDTGITRENASRLVPLWRFTTGAVVTASPIVAEVELPGEGATQVVYVPSWDGHLYALRGADGSLVWSYEFKPHPGGSYPQAGSASVDDIDGRATVFIASGMTLYSLDAATGDLRWEFDAGTGCTECDFLTERNEVISSPGVFEGVVYFGMDVNDFGDGKGGFYAVDARTGTLVWYFDVTTGSSCRPDPGDDVRRFDGYHDAEELGLPSDFFATRSGCDHARHGNRCGSVWSSGAIDPLRRLVFTASSNCDTDDDPETREPPPPMPPYDEAIFALDLDTGEPAWVWRPREVDNDDLAFGGVPNLFEIEVDGRTRDVVGVGGKDGLYYVLDRDGVNEVTGRIEPYWQTRLVPGGDIGGIIASAAVGDGRIWASTAIGTDLAAMQTPAAWGLDATTGEILWGNEDAVPSFAPTSAIPGVVFMGSIAGAVFVYDAETGEILNRLTVGGPASSPAVVVDGRVFVGAGTGARGGSPAAIAFQTSLLPSPVSAFCVAGTRDCPEQGSCDDGNACTIDGRDADGACVNDRIADGTACTLGAFSGTCAAGVCLLEQLLCDDQNQCTEDAATRSGCRFEPVPDDTPCVVRDDAGSCRDGVCIPVP